MKPSKQFIVRDREAGNWISEHDTLSDAVKAIDTYEYEDRRDGSYTADFYEIAVKNINEEYITYSYK